MNTLRTITIAIAYIIGILLAMLFPVDIPLWLIIIISSIGIAGSIIFYIREHNWQKQSVIIVSLAIALISLPFGYRRTMQKTDNSHSNSLGYILNATAPNTPIRIKGTICAEPELRGNINGDLKICVKSIKIAKETEWREIKPAKVLVRAYTMRRRNEDITKAFNHLMHPDAYGYQVEINTTVPVPEPPLNPGGFNLARFLSQNGLLTRFKCYAGRITITRETKGNFVTEIALKAKQSFIQTYKNTIREPASRLVAAATLGTRHAMDKTDFKGLDITQSFRHAGVGHVLAVSGLHVSIVSLLLFTIFRTVGLRPRVFVPAQIIILIMFAVLTGARPSSVRAVVMNSIILLAIAYFKCNIRSATYAGLSLASLFILIINPVVLFSPGFLLSFGAVLSLVLLSTPVTRSLKLLRGFSLLFAAIWLIMLIAISYTGAQFFLNIKNVIGLIGLLWTGILIGTALNERFPKAWTIGMDNMHPAIIMLISAQFAIQIGMMIPLSSWFFGNFPVAGIVVNLVAIPAIGILVQLGMLTGIIGLIPIIGNYLALPFGVADTIVANLFFELANAGATYFPFPITPKPTTSWMFTYYITITGLIVLESQRIKIQALAYRYRPTFKKSQTLQQLPYIIPIILLCTPLLNIIKVPEKCDKVVCLASKRYPLVSIISENKNTILINAGSDYRGPRAIFSTLRQYGSIKINTAILCSPDPAAGLSSLTKLNQKIKINNILLPATGTNRTEYMQALGDDYLIAMDKEGKSWRTRHGDPYTNLLAQLPKSTTLNSISTGPVFVWNNASLEVLPLPEKLPTKFISSAKTRIMSLNQQGFRWLIITDSSSRALWQIIKKDSKPYDVLLISDLTYRKSFPKLLAQAIKQTKPKVVIIAGDQIIEDFTLPAVKGLATPFLFMNATDGAVIGTIGKDGNLNLKAHASGKTITIPSDTHKI
jgi:ComEC/Rec2-related protein